MKPLPTPAKRGRPVNDLQRVIKNAAREFAKLPKAEQRRLKAVFRGNECPECDGFGSKRFYDPSPQGQPWIMVGCSCDCHQRGIYCPRRA